ncbi:MAG: HAMP domain-containing sensor histidine kinase, partial [Nitrospirota bacterium]
MIRLPVKTLRFKIALSLIAFVLLTSWVLSFIFVVNDLNRISEDIRREGEFFAMTLASVIPDLLLSRDYEGIANILENVKEKKMFAYVLVTDSEGDIVAQTDGQLKTENKEIMKVSKTVSSDGRAIGKVEVGIRFDGFFPRMGKVLLEAFAFTLFFMFIGTLLSMVLSKKITAPVEKLSRRVMAFTGFGEEIEKPPSRDEVEIMERSFNQMIDGLKQKQDQIEEKSKELMDMAGGISHELNNIINIIIGFSRVLQKEIPEEGEHYRDVETIMREAKKAKAVVENLMAFAKPSEIQYTYCDMIDCLESCIADIDSQIKAQGISVKREYEEGLPHVEGDERQLREAFFNIILNSVQAMPSGGELTLNCRRVNNILELKIADTGEGIPDEMKERIFDPLFTTKKGGWGIGLGLPISYRIIESHKGELSFTSKKGEGTTFFIRIPID